MFGREKIEENKRRVIANEKRCRDIFRAIVENGEDIKYLKEKVENQNKVIVGLIKYFKLDFEWYKDTDNSVMSTRPLEKKIKFFKKRSTRCLKGRK